MTASEVDDVVIDDLRDGASDASDAPYAPERLAGDVYRSALGVSTRAPEPLVCVTFWSKRPLAFNRTHLPLARRIAYHLGLAASRGELGSTPHPADEERAPRVDAGGPRGLERTAAGLHLRAVGASAEWRDVLAKATQVAATDTTVVITGESGTGKEVVARLIHAASARRAGPFVAINCAALPEQLLESELFGHERGAFTDARLQKRGLLETADGGTVFLDEIAEMVPGLQAKLLRFLEEKTFKRVGGATDIHVDVRVVAATNRNLEDEVAKGRFRSDLFYRLNVLPISMPPLRAHPEDVPLLVEYFIDAFNTEFRKRVLGASPAAYTVLERYGWPGNVRELRNVVERAMLLTEGDRLDARDFAALTTAAGAPDAFELPATGVDLEQLERSLVIQALRRSGGNQTKAAALLGLNRDQIRYRIEKFGLTVPH
jgi:transcriptional regulator with PAS, ATPase and Fis domain